jgi:hypothetical protein
MQTEHKEILKVIHESIIFTMGLQTLAWSLRAHKMLAKKKTKRGNM